MREQPVRASAAERKLEKGYWPAPRGHGDHCGGNHPGMFLGGCVSRVNRLFLSGSLSGALRVESGEHDGLLHPALLFVFAVHVRVSGGDDSHGERRDGTRTHRQRKMRVQGLRVLGKGFAGEISGKALTWQGLRFYRSEASGVKAQASQGSVCKGLMPTSQVCSAGGIPHAERAVTSPQHINIVCQVHGVGMHHIPCSYTNTLHLIAMTLARCTIIVWPRCSVCVGVAFCGWL